MLVTTPAARTGLRLRERPDGRPVNMAEPTECRALALAPPSLAERDLGGVQS
jgi:hypothetical protein